MFFAFFGLGAQELLILALLVIVPIIIVTVILVKNQSSKGSANRMTQLEEENRRLREELDRDR